MKKSIISERHKKNKYDMSEIDRSQVNFSKGKMDAKSDLDESKHRASSDEANV